MYDVLWVLCPSDVMRIRYLKKILTFLEIHFLEFFTRLQVFKKNNVLNDTNTRYFTKIMFINDFELRKRNIFDFMK